MTSDHGDPIAVSSLLLLSAAVVAAFFGAYQLLETYVLRHRFDEPTLQMLHTIRGITGSVLVAAFVAYYMVRHPTAGFNERDPASVIDRQKRQIEHVRWFVQMRWVAAAFALALIVIAVPLTSILAVDHLPQLLVWLVILIGANIFFASQIDSGVAVDTQIITQVVVDLIILTGLLNASGGIENPLSIAYLFHVIIAGILLPRKKAIGVALAASGFFCVLAMGELFELLPHSTMMLFPHGPNGHPHAAHNVLFVTGHTVSFVGVMLLTAYFTTLVSDRLHRSENELEDAARTAVLDRRRLEGVIDAAGLGIIVVGRDLTVEWFNQRVAHWLGWSGESAGKLPHLHEGSSACLACLTTATMADGQKREGEARIRFNGNGTRFFRYVASPVRDSDGQIVQVADVVEDVTERKALETEALHASRLSVLGQLAAGVAHEIGNPLSSLHARLQLMKRRNDPEFAHDSLDILQTQIDRIGHIVRGVSNLARKSGESWTAIDVNAVVEEALGLVKFDKRAANVEFERDLRAPLPKVHGIREQVLQVFINFLLNAVESMPEGGRARVASFARDHSVCVSVSDSGTGIDESIRARLFEPFFTTKPDGTGLGLSICYSLVHAHGGSIEVCSEKDKGSCFTVVLPAPAEIVPA
ncbi:MAG TPA: ATP-binding protein [Thermoanaerobaculia bacterium]|nr:ATP-binding protein [Thermoanaerobaculia bacterium]